MMFSSCENGSRSKDVWGSGKLYDSLPSYSTYSVSAPKTYDEVQSRSGRWGSRLTITMTAEFLQQAQTVGSDISMNLVTLKCKFASFLPFIYSMGLLPFGIGREHKHGHNER